MRRSAPDFAALYGQALEKHLLRSGEQALHHAYELGRQALAQGLGIIEITLFHHGALARFLAAHPTRRNSDWLELSADFLSECLSSFEMTLLGYKEANERLLTAHEQLKAEVAERHKAEEALLHAKKLQAVGLLAGGVAHHFNNLLTVVLGSLELARRRIDDARIDRLLAAAEQSAHHGATITRHLLSFSRQQMLQPGRINVGEWLDDLEALLAGAVRGDIAVAIHSAHDIDAVEVDRSQLDLALLNLAVNARDAMPHGGSLSVTARRAQVADGHLGLHGPYIVIEVADTGHGVDPKLIPQLFEPFFTTKADAAGTGLGLSQVHGFAHQSGGAVEMESAPGQGTRVRLYLPALPRLAAPAKDIYPPPKGRSAHILVVEDNADVADVAAEMLHTFGYSVQCADQAQAALDLLGRGEPVDLLFSDVIMPGGMNGVELAEEVQRRFPKLPILLTSGYSDAVQSVDQKGLPHIAKPYRSEMLRARIGELLGAAAKR